MRLHFETNERERGVGFILEYKEVGKWSYDLILSLVKSHKGALL